MDYNALHISLLHQSKEIPKAENKIKLSSKLADLLMWKLYLFTYSNDSNE